MPNYTVTLYETIYHTVDVEAETADTAVDLAFDAVIGTREPFNDENAGYDTDSQGISTWTVEEN